MKKTSGARDGELIGVVHLRPLPGSPRHVEDVGRIEKAALADARALMEGGMDGLVVENYGDVPFSAGSVPPVTVACMTRVACRIRERFPRAWLGVNVLRNDARAALGIASACEADFIRVNVLAGAMLTDQGIVVSDAFRLLRERAAWAPGVRILADVLVKHAVPLGDADPGRAAADLVERSLADGLIVTGPATGEAADAAVIEAVRRAAPDTPLWAGSGVRTATVRSLLERVQGVIVGTALKRGGVTTNPVDPRRVRAFVRAARAG